VRHWGSLREGKYPGWMARLVLEAHERPGAVHLAPSSWEPLERKRGKLLASAVRQGCELAWRRVRPRLPHETDEPHRIADRVTVGLAGIQSGLAGGRLRIDALSPSDAEICAAYAVNELNGFPTWFVDLARHHPGATRSVLVECMRGEWHLRPDCQRVHGVLQRLLWCDETLGALVQRELLSLLRGGDPAAPSVLECALALLLRGPSANQRELAALAVERVTKYEPQMLGWIYWTAAWVHVDFAPALCHLEDTFVSCPDAEATMTRLCSVLSGEESNQGPVASDASYLSVDVLRRLIPLVFKYVSPSKDAVHTGSYTPSTRDNAQQFRNGLLERLSALEGPDARDALAALASDPAVAPFKPWVTTLLNDATQRSADEDAWAPADIRAFVKEHEIDPKNDQGLFRLACKRLESIRWDVEQSENSLREEVHPEAAEYALRRWLARKLDERARNRYSVSQEAEIDQAERHDIRISRPGLNCVSIEVKWADNWTLADLVDALKNQLVGKYLRAHDSRFGVYVLGMIGRKKQWMGPGSRRLEFAAIHSEVAQAAMQVAKGNRHIGGLHVVSIDFRDPKLRE